MDRIKIEIGFGAKFDRDGNLLPDVPLRLQMAEFEFMSVFGAFTLIKTFGGWKSPETGIVTFENGYTLFVTVDDTYINRTNAARVANYVKGCFYQEAVCLTITQCSLDLI